MIELIRAGDTDGVGDDVVAGYPGRDVGSRFGRHGDQREVVVSTSSSMSTEDTMTRSPGALRVADQHDQEITMAPPPPILTKWAKQRILSANLNKEAAEAHFRQTIREVVAAREATPTSITRLLGTKNKNRIYDIINAAPEKAAPQPPVMPATVYLRGAGYSDRVWKRVKAAMWTRGWHTTVDRTQAWALTRGGLDVVLCDFSLRNSKESVLDEEPMLDEEGEVLDDTVNIGLVRGTINERKQRFDLEFVDGSGGHFERPKRNDDLDEHDLAEIVAEVLAAKKKPRRSTPSVFRA
ncbi:hypothetical protein [Amycolatopsis sp. NPDC058986]|uniref:hypothetical protein n=1 Tax=unclassified Amycolatopsis TaxID=2618356 RepID=UPI00366FC527